MNILFTICGRAGSKGIKNKNIRIFNGKPLVAYTLSVIDLYMKKKPLNEYDIALNTDSVELKQLVEQYAKFSVTYIQRNKKLASDEVAKRDVIIDTLRCMQNLKNIQYDIVVDLDITSPLRTVNNLSEAIDKWEKTRADVVFSVTPSRRNPYFNMVKKTGAGYKKIIQTNFVTRQEAPEIYDMNASIYVYLREHLEEGRGVLEGYNEIIIMPDTGILDLDHEEDFELMEIIAQYLFDKKTQYSIIYYNI